MDPTNEPRKEVKKGMVSDMQSDQTALDNSMQPPQASNVKKLAIGFVAIVIVLALGIGAYILGSSQSDENAEQTDSSQVADTDIEQTAEENRLQFAFATSEFAYELSEDNELERIAEASENETIVAVSADRSITYVTSQASNDSTAATSLSKIIDGTRTEIVSFADEDGSFQIGALSPNGSLIAYFNTSTSGFEYAFGAIDLETGEIMTGYEMSLDASPLQALVSSGTWISNTELLAGENSCFQCDGPVLATLHVVNIETGDIALLADLSDDKTSNQSLSALRVTKDLGTAFIATDNNSALGGNAESVSASTTTIYSVNLSSGTSEEVAELSGALVNLNGVSSNQQQLLLSVTAPLEDASNSDSDYLEEPTIQTLSLSSGNVSPIPISVSQFDDDFVRINALAFNNDDDTLYFAVTSTPNSDDNPSEQRTVLYALPIESGEENSVSTLFDMKNETFSRVIELNVN